MQLTFAGTRAKLAFSTPRHRRHSLLLVAHAGVRLQIDCGSDWHGRLEELDAAAVLLTHSHEDHAGGLARPLEIAVHATEASWKALPDLAGDPLARRCRPGETLSFNGLRCTPVAVAHSLRAPAVGWRLEAGGRQVFYAPDIAALADPLRTLRGVELYIGDGSSFDPSLERHEAGVPCGHAAMPEQLRWCRLAGVPKALFSHCGEAVLRNEDEAAGLLAELAASTGIDAGFAVDGLVLSL